MPPEMNEERAQLHNLDQRVNVYALGATLFCLLTGCDPSRGPKFGPLPLEKLVFCGESTRRVITKAVAPLRDNRYADMLEMRSEIFDAFRQLRER